MFTDEEPDFCQREYKSSILTMFMRIDRRFMAKCFGQMQELGMYLVQMPEPGSLAAKAGPGRDRYRCSVYWHTKTD